MLLVSQLRRGPGAGSLVALPLHAATPSELRPRRLWPTGDPTVDRRKSGPPAGEPGCVEPPDSTAFAPHGITTTPADASGAVRVAVVAHGQREAIELFDLTGAGDSAALSWRGCIPLPPDTVGNDVSVAPNGEVVVSNYMPSMQGWRALQYTVASALGWDTGDIVTWRADRGWRHLPGTSARCANGVLVAPDGASVYYAETGSGRVCRVPRAGVPPGETVADVNIGGHPDNLSLTPRGRILAATHTAGAAFLLCGFGRLPCRTGWSLFEIDPGTLHATELLHHDGSVVGAVASAAEVDGRVYFGAVFGDRIGVWRPSAPPVH